VNDFDKQKQAEEPLKAPPLGAQSAYPASIEKMSERWREIQQHEQQIEEQKPRSFTERNYLSLGIGIALLIIALLVLIGGFAFLVMRAH